MALIVQKYGGTSVGSLELIKGVAEKVVKAKQAGNKMVVVLSAMAGQTDYLLGLARSMSEQPDLREVDSLISTGEQVSTSLFCLACMDMGVKAKSLLGSQAGIFTDSTHGKAQILNCDPRRIHELLDGDVIVAAAGFQGVDQFGDITTLGRGGTDTTAVALAGALNADVCEIYTDVNGVYTTDPNICPQARKLEYISYEEMLEMASLGAKVMETRSVEFAMKYNAPIHVRHSRSDEMGTIIRQEDPGLAGAIVSGVAYNKNEARITLTKVPDRPGVAARILEIVSGAGVAVDMILQNTSRGRERTDFSFTVPQSDFDRTMPLVRAAAEEVGAEDVLGDTQIAKISIVGAGMRSEYGVAATMFYALSQDNINIRMISTSDIKVSVIVTEKYTELAVRALHDAFALHIPEAPIKAPAEALSDTGGDVYSLAPPAGLEGGPFTNNGGKNGCREEDVVSGVEVLPAEARLTVTGVPDKPGMAARLLGALSDAKVVVDVIIQNTSAGGEGQTDFSLTVPETDCERALLLLQAAAREIGAGEVLADSGIAKISLVGVGMRTHAGVGAKMFAALSGANINIRMISTSEIKISCIVNQEDALKAKEVLVEAFAFSE